MSRNRRSWCLTSCLAVLTVARLACAEVDCNLDQGPLTVGMLQRARALPNASRLRTSLQRADCAGQLVESAEQASVEGCEPACLRELASLYKDAALLMRRAYVAARDPSNKTDFAKKEVYVRSRLHEKLKNEAKAIDASGQELRRNFGDLADAYELLNDPLSYHQMISADDARGMLGPKAFEVWARALRSCNEWKFPTGSNRDLPQLLRALCGESCRPELEKLEAALPAATSEARAKAQNLVPATAKCPVAQ